MDKLNIVSTDSGVLTISEDNKIRYWSTEITNEESLDRPITVAELYSKLNSRRWHIPVKKMVKTDSSENDNLSFVVDNLEESPSVGMDHGGKTYTGSTNVINQVSPSLDSTNMTQFINNYYKDIMEVLANVSLYNSAKMEVDLTAEGNPSITVDLIEDGKYTNSVSLVGVEKKYTYPGLTGIVDLSVKYTVEDVIHVRDLKFEAFKYYDAGDQGIKSKATDFINTASDVTIEYVDGIVRVIPRSSKVDECIISNCVVTYGII